MTSTDRLHNADSRAVEDATFRIEVRDEPGVMSAVAAVFAGRGVSMETVMAQRIVNRDGSRAAEVVITLRASAHRLAMLRRVLERLDYTVRVTRVPDDSPYLVESALLELDPGSDPPAAAPGVRCSPLDAPDGAPDRYMMYGRPADVVAAIETLRERGTLVSARYARRLFSDPGTGPGR